MAMCTDRAHSQQSLKKGREKVWEGNYRMLQNVRAAKGLKEPNHSSQNVHRAGGQGEPCPYEALHRCVLGAFVLLCFFQE